MQYTLMHYQYNLSNLVSYELFKEFTSEELNSKVTVVTVQELVQKYGSSNFGEVLVIASNYTSTWGWLFAGAIKISRIFNYQVPKTVIYKHVTSDVLGFPDTLNDDLWWGHLDINIKNNPIKFQVYLLKIKL